MKKYLYLLVSLVIISCSADNDLLDNQSIEDNQVLELTSAKSSTAVNLVKAWNSYSYYRGFNTWTRKFTVRVTNLAYDKKVSIYHEKVDGTWEEIPLSYDFSLDDQNEIWIGEYRYTAGTKDKIYDNEFVVKYDVEGSTYWDNNNGNNYSIEEKEVGSFFAQPSLNISVDSDYDSLYPVYGSTSNKFSVVVDVRNIASEKEVKVAYSADGWQTTQYLPLSFTPRWYSGYQYVLLSPNQFNVERWTGSVMLDPSVNSIEYAVVYKVDGQEYWDNNSGRNYTVNTLN